MLNAIYYAVNHGATVIHMSLNYSRSSQELDDAVSYANSMGVICVTAGGNDGRQATVYPGVLKNVIDVASTGDNVTLTRIYWLCSTTRAGLCIFLPSLFSTRKCRRFRHSNYRTNLDLEWRQ
jgi:subtilisin family serine protease